MPNNCQLWLTCANQKEADKIAEVLLQKRLVACVRQVPINSAYRWKGKMESSNEVLLMMESREDLFKKIESEILKLHSYDTFVLSATPTEKISKAAEAWLTKELNK